MLNIQKIKDHFDNDMETLSEILEIFENSSAQYLKDIKRALDNSDYFELNLHAHTLKGMILNFFADEISEKARKLEFMGKTEKIDPNAQAIYDQLYLDTKEIVAKLRLEFNLPGPNK